MSNLTHFKWHSSLIALGFFLCALGPLDRAMASQCSEAQVKAEVAALNSSATWQKRIAGMSRRLQGYHLDPCGRSKIRDEGLYLFIQEMRQSPPIAMTFSQNLDQFTLDPEAKGPENSYVFAKNNHDGSWSPSLHLETDNFRIDHWPTRPKTPKSCSARALIRDLELAIDDFWAAKYCPKSSLTPDAIPRKSTSSAFFVDFRTYFR